MGRKRGNPRWGSGLPLKVSATPSEFDVELRRLGLSTPESCVNSLQLRRWCEKNRNHCYIPEWLLKEWDITVNDEMN